jgi:hypothetical protein
MTKNKKQLAHFRNVSGGLSRSPRPILHHGSGEPKMSRVTNKWAKVGLRLSRLQLFFLRLVWVKKTKNSVLLLTATFKNLASARIWLG